MDGQILSRLLIFGANHRSSSMAIRDRLFVEDTDAPRILDRLKTSGCREALLLSTCDRVEVQAIGADDGAPEQIMAVLAAHADITPEELRGHTYVRSGRAAIHHIFTVAASLDSQVIGETQVLGQMKAAHRQARDAGLMGSTLESVLQGAYSAAKKVHTETAIGEHPVSIAAATRQVARDIFGDLDGRSGLLIGDGEMGELIAGELLAADLGHLTVVHPTDSRSHALARRLGCHKAAYDELAGLLASSDMVLTAMGSRRHTLNTDQMRGALKKRRNQPVFIIDTAIPGDVEAAVNRLDGAFLYGLNDLETVAMRGRSDRKAEALTASHIVEAEVEVFLNDQAERRAVPMLIELRRHFEQVRDDVLQDGGNDVSRATQLLINRLLHEPSEVLRQTAANDRHGEIEKVLEQLFRLNRQSQNEEKDQ